MIITKIKNYITFIFILNAHIATLFYLITTALSCSIFFHSVWVSSHFKYTTRVKRFLSSDYYGNKHDNFKLSSYIISKLKTKTFKKQNEKTKTNQKTTTVLSKSKLLCAKKKVHDYVLGTK